MLGRLSMATIVAAFVFTSAAPAEAQVYKYKKKDGTIIYTDSLSQLPPERRAYYHQLEKDREERLEKLEKALGKEEVEKDRMEKERAAIMRAKLEEEERQRRIAAIDKQLAEIRARRTQVDQSRSDWKKRIETAKKELADALAAFEKEQQEYNRIAMKGGYGLLPGESTKMQKAKEKMDDLEKKIDAANEQLTVTIPEQARRAGVPPGWLR